MHGKNCRFPMPMLGHPYDASLRVAGQPHAKPSWERSSCSRQSSECTLFLGAADRRFAGSFCHCSSCCAEGRRRDSVMAFGNLVGGFLPRHLCSEWGASEGWGHSAHRIWLRHAAGPCRARRRDLFHRMASCNTGSLVRHLFLLPARVSSAPAARSHCARRAKTLRARIAPKGRTVGDQDRGVTFVPEPRATEASDRSSRRRRPPVVTHGQGHGVIGTPPRTCTQLLSDCRAFSNPHKSREPNGW